MRYAFILATIMWWTGVVAAPAQTNPAPGMGPTTPLSAPPGNSSASNSGAPGLGGIPLGATGISPSGVSPLIMPCPNTSSNAAFDGGGSTYSTTCGSASSNSASPGSSLTPGAGGVSPGSTGTIVGSGIPLGATGVSTPGESQTFVVPTPCLPTATPLPGSPSAVGSNSPSVAGGC